MSGFAPGNRCVTNFSERPEVLHKPLGGGNKNMAFDHNLSIWRENRTRAEFYKKITLSQSVIML